MKPMFLASVLAGLMVVTSACAPAPAAPAPAQEPAPAPAAEPAPAPADQGMYKDGSYRAEMKDFDLENGWKDSVDITVAGGKITAVVWNGTYKDGGDDKINASKNGKYPMVEQGGAKAPWHEQAALVEAYLIKTQDPLAVKLTDDAGHTDAISGATMKVKGFLELAQEALATAK